MEDLLTPQICMDIDDTPLDVGKDDDTSDDNSSESGEPEMGEDGKVKMLLEEQFTDSVQVPEELTDFEKDAKKNVFAIGEPAVQFHRLHCTACNIHLGSAPIGHFNRYIHPLLKVLLCKSCYEFYCSGEFDKDEDGSEMYCRWCGQGGKVMCCAQCAYVFCQKCVRQNLGKRTLELIKDSDDWLCFACNPTQLINLKIICTSLFDFVQEEIRLSKSLNNIERLKIDHSVCCQKTKAAKRKRDEDTTYTPNEWEEQSKPKKPSILKNTLSKPLLVEDNKDAKQKNWSQKEEAEVVCTPDLMALMEDDPPPLTPMPKSVQLNKPGPASMVLNKQFNKVQLTAKDQVPTQIRAIRPDGKKLYTIAPKTMMICNANNLQRAPSGLIRLQTPAIKFVPSLNRTAPIVNSIPSQIVPGTRHEWYDKAATVVSTITGNLSGTLMNLTKEQRSAKTVEQLANIHNKLQELLSSSVNSLIQVRKNLRAEFLDDLNKLKFPNSNSHRSSNTSTVTKPKFNNSSNKENDDDDDVIIVNSESSSVKSFAEPPPLVKISTDAKSNSRPYLKVRSVSQLLAVSSECITIPDDPPGSSCEGDDVIAVEEKDPLEISPSTSDQSTINVNSKHNDSITKNVCELDDDTIRIKNTLTESRIDQMVIENMKYKVIGISQEELKRILSVRVLISTNFGNELPENRLKTVDGFVDDNEINVIANEENSVGIMDVDSQTNDDNAKSSEKTEDKMEEDGRRSVTNCSDNENNPESDKIEENEIKNNKEKETETESLEKVDNNNDTVLENEVNKNCSEELNELNEEDKRDTNTNSIPVNNDSTPDNNVSTPDNKDSTSDNKNTSQENDDSSPDNNDSSPENNDSSPENNDPSPVNADFLPETNDSPVENNDSFPENNGSVPETNDSGPENNDSGPENNDSASENNDSAPENDSLSENEAEEESNIMEENGLDPLNETKSSEKIVDCNESSALSSHSESSVNTNKDCNSISEPFSTERIAMDSCIGDDSK